MYLAICIPAMVFMFLSPFNKRYKEIAWLAYIFFAVCFCLRGEMATDWQAYKMYYDNVFNESIRRLSGFEVGFVWICKLFKSIGFSYWVFNICISVVIAFLFYKSIKIYTENVGLAIFLGLLYFFYPSLEALRQMLAVAIFLYSLQYIESNLKKYFVLNIFAVFFHKVSLLAFVFFIFFKFKKIRKLFCIAMVGFPIVQPLVEKIIIHIPALYQKYYWYVKFLGGNNDFSYVFSFKTLEYIAVITALMFLRVRQNKNDYCIEESNTFYAINIIDRNTMEKIVIPLLVMGLFIHLGLGRMMDSTYRLLYYSDVGLILGICFIYDRLRYVYQRFFLLMIVDAYILLKFISIIQSNPQLFGI